MKLGKWKTSRLAVQYLQTVPKATGKANKPNNNHIDLTYCIEKNQKEFTIL